MTPIRRLFQHDLYCEELDWFFGSLAHCSGHKSCQGSQEAVLNGLAVGSDYCSESNTYTDQQAGWPGNLRRLDGSYRGALCHFRRGRAIWRVFNGLDWQHQRTLIDWYEPRHYWPKERNRAPENDVKAAHWAYYREREKRAAHGSRGTL